MNRHLIRNMVLSGLFLALGLILPFLTGQIPGIGARLLPMHIPVLLCGFVCGGPAGALVGFALPLFRSILFGMPPMFPTAIAMAFELATYGLVSGVAYQWLSRKPVNILTSLLTAMISGRIVWGLVSWTLYTLSGSAFTWQVFAAGAVVNAVPGLILQVVLIPILILALQRARVLEYERS